MQWSSSFLISLCAIGLAGSISPASAKTQVVKVSQRYPFAVCTGVCPNYDLQLHADGRVELRRVEFDGPDEYDSFRVSARSAARFMQTVEKLRPPKGRDVEETDCGADDPHDLAPLHLDVKEVQIAWIDGDDAQHLEGCGTTERTVTLMDTLRLIGLYLDGRTNPSSR